jgi:hypothetical protein
MKVEMCLLLGSILYEVAKNGLGFTTRLLVRKVRNLSVFTKMVTIALPISDKHAGAGEPGYVAQ